MQTETVQQNRIVNGVDVDGIFSVIDAVRQDSGLAAFRFRARNRWQGGGRNRSTIQGFHGCRMEDETRTQPFVLDNDEPRVLLGEDAAPNPVEFILHALAGCLTTTMVYHAASRGIVIEAVESELEGDLDLRGFLGLSETVRKGYQAIRVRLRVTSAASADVLRSLALYSPVFDVVSRSVPVDVVVETR